MQEGRWIQRDGFPNEEKKDKQGITQQTTGDTSPLSPTARERGRDEGLLAYNLTNSRKYLSYKTQE
ncbi:MAG TPA: hypothetical protein PKV16_05290 [Caldisericia bacterium]|nr:hypothetical protein [Caldisericia bacterium]HPF48728.1 hypothetical protein [Caldisericia bacterium]HPI83612.1 hypothetical protein [Caldisericia bacterium]HPQ93183.1 hypothetical protein [Caldisericia bacterium]HRV74984.1 hypothetical protein [Caldisericia bacterium]